MAQIRSDNALREDTRTTPGVMDISLEFIQEDPVAVLQMLSADALPNSFRLENSPQTIDLGGVSKQVYYTLFSSLIENSPLYLNDKQIPSVEKGAIDEIKSLQIYHTLGAFYSRFAIRNQERSDPFLTGQVFSPQFFHMIKILGVSPNADIDLLTLLESVDKENKACFSLLKDPKNEKLKTDVKNLMLNIYGVEGDENKELAFATEIFDRYKNPILHFIKGASTSGVSEEFFSNIRRLTPEQISEWLQGKTVSKELVLSSLVVENDQNPHFIDYVTWVKENINSADQEWLEKFVFAITGRKVLAFNTKIKLRLTWREGAVFEIHTCFNSLDFPRIKLEKDAFLTNLEDALISDHNIA